MSNIDFQPVRVRTGSRDATGRLVMIDGELTAVLVRLDDPVHEDLRGGWFLETGFGRLTGVNAPVFRDLGEAADWMRGRTD